MTLATGGIRNIVGWPPQILHVSDKLKARVKRQCCACCFARLITTIAERNSVRSIRHLRSESLNECYGDLSPIEPIASAAARITSGLPTNWELSCRLHSLTGECRLRKMNRPEDLGSPSDRPNHLALPHY